MRVTQQEPLMAADALGLLGASGLLHDATDVGVLLAVLPRLVAGLVAFDALEVRGPSMPPGFGPPVDSLEHRLEIATHGARDVVGGVLLGRRTRPFDRRDAAMAGLLGPIIVAAADHVRLRELHSGAPARLAALTARERQVLALVADGRTTRDIAALLYIEARTVEKHVEHIRAKLGARSRAEAAATWARAAAVA